MSKPFFYKLNAADFFGVVRELSDKECASWLKTFASDLVAGNSNNYYTNSLILEAKKFKENRSLAGKKGMEHRYQSSNSVITQLKQNPNKDITNSSSSNNNNNNTKDNKPYLEILNDLNQKGGYKYRLGEGIKKEINGRLSEGYTKEDFFQVHSVMIAKWKDDENMSQYLRPDTLYRASKFPGYLNTKMPESKCITPDWM